MTVAELEVRMSNREYVEQQVYDKIELERRQEAELDAKLLADNVAASRRMRS